MVTSVGRGGQTCVIREKIRKDDGSNELASARPTQSERKLIKLTSLIGYIRHIREELDSGIQITYYFT